MNIVIIGAGGHGRVVLDILRNNHQFDIAGFLDANTSLQGKEVCDLPVLGDLSMSERLNELGIGGAIIAIGDNMIRNAYAQRLDEAGINLVSAIHPSANIAQTSSIGKNIVIAAGSNICTLAKIEDSVIINTGCIIDHESIIHRSAHICPGVRMAGHVTVKPYAFVGIGATIIQGITIGESAVVGAGAVVVQDVPAYTTVVGVPAKPIKRQPPPSQTVNEPDTNACQPLPTRNRPFDSDANDLIENIVTPQKPTTSHPVGS